MPRSQVRGCLVLVAGIVVAQPLPAQAPTDRAALEQFRDSLDRTRDTLVLETLRIRVANAVIAHPDDQVARLRRGYLELRLGDVVGAIGHMPIALDIFRHLTDEKPEWPYAWLGRGLAELSDAEHELGALLASERFFRIDPLSHAKECLARATELDSLFTSGLVELANAAMRQHNFNRMETALGALRRLDRSPARRAPEILLARARMEREVGEPDSALVALDSLLIHRPDDPAALLERARTLFTLGKISGAESWYTGLQVADTATLGLYRSDLVAFLPDSTMRQFDQAASGAARVALMMQFWASHDPDGLPSGRERLRDHYVRLDHARRTYIPAGQYDLVERFHPSTAAFDDRGLIYIRHGAPDQRTFVAMPGLPPNETWWYDGVNGKPLVFNFVVYEGTPGYRLVHSMFDLLALSGQAKIAQRGDRGLLVSDTAGKPVETYGAALLAQTAEELLSSRKGMPIYSKIYAGGKDSAAALQAEERELARESIAAPESWRLSYASDIAADVQVLIAGARASSPQLQVAFAIAERSLSGTRVRNGVVYPVRMRASVVAPDGKVVVVVDTLRSFLAPDWIAPFGHLLGRLPLNVPPGHYTVRVALETNDRGILTAPQDIDVPAPAKPVLALSDLVLGTRSVRLLLPGAQGDTAWINPMRTFTQKQQMELYCEVMGLAPGAPYRMELAVRRGEERGTPALTIAFDARSSALIDAVHREISLKNLGTGDYTLEAKISAPSGETVTRTMRFRVIKP